MSIRETYHKASSAASQGLGSPYAFLIACGGILVWAILGPTMRYSETWQLVINTATTIITFLIVFLIQNTQNRDSKATHLKEARDELIHLEDMPEEEVRRIAEEFHKMKHQPTQAPAQKP